MVELNLDEENPSKSYLTGRDSCPMTTSAPSSSSSAHHSRNWQM